MQAATTGTFGASAPPRPDDPVPAAAPPGRAGERWRASLVALAVATAVYLVVGLSVAHLPWSGIEPRTRFFPGRTWLEGWVHFDAGWYYEIAENGYSFADGRQTPVAFFPAYPLLMRAVGDVLGSWLLAGVLVTLASGVAAAALFHAWLRHKLSPPAAWTALLLFLLYPYAFFLYGAVYADALFIAAAIGSFLLVERDRPWLAGLVGAVATAARPLGFVLLVGLALRLVERRGGLRRVRWRDAGVLVAGLGIGSFCLYLWGRFGSPLAFLEAQEAWAQEAGWRTWLKVQFFRDIADARSPAAWLVFAAHPALTLASLALVPRVVRRFGWGYGVFTLLVVGLAALGTKNFFGMARYVLAAFPVFAVAGDWLAARPRLRVAGLAAAALLLAVASSHFARGHYLS
jgi:hypothetical protein